MNNGSTRRLKDISCGMAAVGVALLSSSAWATLIPAATKSVVTADNKALIEVLVPGASVKTTYAFQVATAGKGGDCKNELSSTTTNRIGGCIASVQGTKNSALITLPPQSAKYQYRVLAYDPNGSNPKNSGWSSWGALFQVTGISPTTDVKVGKTTTFSISGNGSGPKSMTFELVNCQSSGGNGFTCTPNAAGSKEWVVKDQSGGTALAKGTINVLSNTGVPAVVSCPVDGSGWTANSIKSPFHVPGLGIEKADDTFAFDLNLNSPAWDSDSNKPVKAVEAGEIVATGRWGGKSSGQLLIKHITNGQQWSSGYLHLKNISKSKGTVYKGEVIGYISSTNTAGKGGVSLPACTKLGQADCMANHLHFAVYAGHDETKLVSKKVTLDCSPKLTP